jgi:hypothetical protein
MESPFLQLCTSLRFIVLSGLRFFNDSYRGLEYRLAMAIETGRKIARISIQNNVKATGTYLRKGCGQSGYAL